MRESAPANPTHRQTVHHFPVRTCPRNSPAAKVLPKIASKKGERPDASRRWVSSLGVSERKGPAQKNKSCRAHQIEKPLPTP